ncbi:unnamed protein product, partial [Schistosoma turkestanicum]
DHIIPIPSSYMTWLPEPLSRRSMAASLITLSMLQKLHIFNNASLVQFKNQDYIGHFKLYLVISTGINPFWDR